MSGGENERMAFWRNLIGDILNLYFLIECNIFVLRSQ